VGRKFDLQLLVHKVELYLKSCAPKMTTGKLWPNKASSVGGEYYTPASDVWMWFKLADSAGLTVCLPAIAKRITEFKHTCKQDENLQGLSAAYQLLVKALVDA
jgi:hypothetical protein